MPRRSCDKFALHVLARQRQTRLHSTCCILGSQLCKVLSFTLQKRRCYIYRKVGHLHNDEWASLVWRRHRLVNSSTNRRAIIYGDLVVCLLDVLRGSTELCKAHP